jgi:hypothetical protein
LLTDHLGGRHESLALVIASLGVCVFTADYSPWPAASSPASLCMHASTVDALRTRRHRNICILTAGGCAVFARDQGPQGKSSRWTFPSGLPRIGPLASEPSDDGAPTHVSDDTRAELQQQTNGADGVMFDRSRLRCVEGCDEVTAVTTSMSARFLQNFSQIFGPELRRLPPHRSLGMRALGPPTRPRALPRDVTTL